MNTDELIKAYKDLIYELDHTRQTGLKEVQLRSQIASLSDQVVEEKSPCCDFEMISGQCQRCLTKYPRLSGEYFEKVMIKDESDFPKESGWYTTELGRKYYFSKEKKWSGSNRINWYLRYVSVHPIKPDLNQPEKQLDESVEKVKAILHEIQSRRGDIQELSFNEIAKELTNTLSLTSAPLDVTEAEIESYADEYLKHPSFEVNLIGDDARDDRSVKRFVRYGIRTGAKWAIARMKQNKK